MRTTTAPAIVQIEAKDLRKFTPVDETLATEFLFPQPSANDKKFGITDLWNCHNQRRMYGIKIR
jgi:hypothetical protein